MKNTILLKETLKEINRLKGNCSANSSIYTLLVVRFLLLLFCFQSMHETTEMSNAIMRSPKSLAPSPTVANIASIIPYYKP